MTCRGARRRRCRCGEGVWTPDRVPEYCSVPAGLRWKEGRFQLEDGTAGDPQSLCSIIFLNLNLNLNLSFNLNLNLSIPISISISVSILGRTAGVGRRHVFLVPPACATKRSFANANAQRHPQELQEGAGANAGHASVNALPPAGLKGLRHALTGCSC